jgi:hypothetical protein
MRDLLGTHLDCSRTQADLSAALQRRNAPGDQRARRRFAHTRLFELGLQRLARRTTHAAASARPLTPLRVTAWNRSRVRRTRVHRSPRRARGSTRHTRPSSGRATAPDIGQFDIKSAYRTCAPGTRDAGDPGSSPPHHDPVIQRFPTELLRAEPRCREIKSPGPRGHRRARAPQGARRCAAAPAPVGGRRHNTRRRS